MKKICYLILRMLGYRIDLVNIPKQKKYVLVFAPHTSMLDFIIGWMALRSMGVPTLFLIKSEAFFFPLGALLKKLGGVPVNRKNASRFYLYAAEIIRERENVALLVAPEGMRKKNPKWKKGFYYIAKEAHVPVMLGYLDYRSRRGGIGAEFPLTDDADHDIAEIKKYYYGMRGRYKGCFDLEEMPYAHEEWVNEG